MPACWIASTLAVLVLPFITVETHAPSAPGGLHLTARALLARPFELGDAKQNVERSRTFTLTYSASLRKLPANAKAIDLWLPWPQTDVNQTIHRVDVDASGPVSIGREPRFGNQCLHVRARATDNVLKVSMAIEATRKENSGASDRLRDEDRGLYLSAEPLVPLSGPVKELALQATRGLTGDSEKARAIFDRVTRMMTYDKSGTGWGRGDAIFACEAKRGNCTDFHALIIGMARSIGIPARFAIGVPLPEARGAGEIAGYHCWAELYVKDRGWVPVDASEAARFPKKREYYFGHHDENRLELSRGRHLILEPAQHGQPINFFVFPYAEVDGKPFESVDQRITFADSARGDALHRQSTSQKSRAIDELPSGG
jgi:transglutaminase-like putative cysteine protease